MRPLGETRGLVVESIAPLGEYEVALSSAVGLVLSRPITATQDLPSFANASVDGFGVSLADLRDTFDLLVVEAVAAGAATERVLGPGEAIRIMTGAPIPSGCDAVVMIEDVVISGDRVTIGAVPQRGEGIRLAGGDIRAGDRVFEAGTVLTPAHLGVLAALGVVSPGVTRRARVAIISTGDEVKPPDQRELAPGQIRDSNRPLLAALVQEARCDVVDMGIIPDQEEALRRAFLEAVEQADVVIASGGVSVGDYDLVKQVLSEVGEIRLWRVAAQPGKPFAFGTVAGKPFFGLPGNPVSVMVGWEQLVRPALLTMMGHRLVLRPREWAKAGERLITNAEKIVFLRSMVDRSGEGQKVALSGGQASNVLSAVAMANCFAVVPRGVAEVEINEPVQIEMFRLPANRELEEGSDD